MMYGSIFDTQLKILREYGPKSSPSVLRSLFNRTLWVAAGIETSSYRNGDYAGLLKTYRKFRRCMTDIRQGLASESAKSEADIMVGFIDEAIEGAYRDFESRWLMSRN